MTGNRLDLARLRRLEETLAEREDTIARRQARLWGKVGESERRDGRIAELETLSRAPAAEPAKPVPGDRDLHDLLRRADAAEKRCARLEPSHVLPEFLSDEESLNSLNYPTNLTRIIEADFDRIARHVHEAANLTLAAIEEKTDNPSV